MVWSFLVEVFSLTHFQSVSLNSNWKSVYIVMWKPWEHSVLVVCPLFWLSFDELLKNCNFTKKELTYRLFAKILTHFGSISISGPLKSRVFLAFPRAIELKLCPEMSENLPAAKYMFKINNKTWTNIFIINLSTLKMFLSEYFPERKGMDG